MGDVYLTAELADVRAENVTLTQTIADLRQHNADLIKQNERLGAALERLGMRDMTHHPSLRVVK